MKADDYAALVQAVMEAGKIQKCPHDKLERTERGVYCPTCGATIVGEEPEAE
jgi:formate dehydrogenase maturation protein FdhE